MMRRGGESVNGNSGCERRYMIVILPTADHGKKAGLVRARLRYGHVRPTQSPSKRDY
jgi:hypothetical protein